MSYDSKSIVLVNLGEYGRNGRGDIKEHPPSIDHIPLFDYRGFRYLDVFLSEPEKTADPKNAFRFVVHPFDRAYIKTVTYALARFPVTVKCQGKYNECKEPAVKLVLPYEPVKNVDERIATGAPHWVNQTDVKRSSFCCGICADYMASENSGRAKKLDISFALPRELAEFPYRRGWNLDRQELHRRMKLVASQLIAGGMDDMIDFSAISREKLTPIRELGAQAIVNKVVAKVQGLPVRQLPSRRDYSERYLRWDEVHDKKGPALLPFEFAETA
jgi:hypothetical protein